MVDLKKLRKDIKEEVDLMLVKDIPQSSAFYIFLTLILITLGFIVWGFFNDYDNLRESVSDYCYNICIRDPGFDYKSPFINCTCVTPNATIGRNWSANAQKKGFWDNVTTTST